MPEAVRTAAGIDQVEITRQELNKAIADLTALRATVAAIITAAGTDIAAVAAVTAPAALTSAAVTLRS